MIITFVISRQKTIPNIRQLMEALSNQYGAVLEDGQDLGEEDDRGKTSGQEKENDREEESGLGRCLPSTRSFPALSQLCLVSLDDSMRLKLGYRAKYIHRLCQDVVSDRLELSHLNILGYEGAMEYLAGPYGIGKKVADYVCFFSLHRIDMFPVDIWTEEILMKQCFGRKKYHCIPRSRLCETIVEDMFG